MVLPARLFAPDCACWKSARQSWKPCKRR
ncbi:UNVERIFIED_CONTAM: hypothetical protein GTU68_037248 [Idotea baltica]|nr:hypothetical protein [Idotea baltica]